MGVALPTSVDATRNYAISGPFPYPGESEASWASREAAMNAADESHPEFPDSVFMGRWRVGGKVAPGFFFLVTPDLAVANVNQAGQDVSSLLGLVETGDIIHIVTATGSNDVTVGTIDAETGYYNFEVVGENAVGYFLGNQVASIFLEAVA